MNEFRRERGRAGRLAGRGAEVVAAALLLVKGYQILGFRLRTPRGEIDLLARQGRYLVVVEVKRRANLELALTALTIEQRQRLLDAARSLMDRRPALRRLTIRLDLIALAPGKFPRHARDILVESGFAQV